jgi:polyhydroxyalkanoate synthase
MTTRLMANPAKLVQAQIGFWQDYLTLWSNTARRIMGEQVGSVIDEPKGDRRFKDDAWRENEVFDFIRQSYLLSARFFTSTVNSAEGWTPRRHRRWTSTRASSWTR